jgi:hypothetical protein
MQTANELLYGILQTVGKIEQNTRGSKSSGGGGSAEAPKSKVSILSNLGSALGSFKNVTPKSLKTFFSFMDQMLVVADKAGKNKKFSEFSASIIHIGQGLPGIASGLESLSEIKAKNMSSAIRGLDLIYKFMVEAGEKSKTEKIDRAVKTFEKLGKGLSKISKPIKDIALGFAYLGVGILAFVGSMLLTAMLLKVSSPMDVLLFVGATVLAVVLMYGILALLGGVIHKGTKSIEGMGIGMAVLSLGILSFAITMRLLPMILGKESGGSIFRSLLIMVGIVGAMALMFGILSLVGEVTKKGFMSILFMSLGLAVLSLAILGLAMTAKMLMSGLSPASATKEEKDDNKKSIIKGLGMMGLIILAAVGLFMLVGIPAVAALILLGAITMIAMSASLYLMAKSVEKLVSVGEKLAGKDIGKTLTSLIGGTIDGFLGGLSSLSGGQKGVRGVLEFIKNSAKIFAGVAVLMSMSIALSMFAWAISAFATLNEMRPILGTNKDGSPIFGDKINVLQVSRNMTMSLTTFLTELISSTEKLTYSKAAALGRLARSLTGERGILSAVSDFSKLLKTFSEFGPSGEVGFVNMIPDGTDQDGNAKWKQVPTKVKITTIAKNIADSFGTFVDELVKHSSMFELDGDKGKSMMKLAEILMGTDSLKVFGLSFGRKKPGLLEPITKFSEILTQYANFGDGNTIPILDAEGKVTKVVKVEEVAKNIISTLGKFSASLGNTQVLADTEKAEKNIGKFSDLMKTTKEITESLDSLNKASNSVSDLARSIKDLSVSLDGLDSARLSKLAAVSSAAGGGTVSTGGNNGATTAPNLASKVDAKTQIIKESSQSPANWDNIAAQIGNQVGAQILTAMKKGHLKFEFSPSSQGTGVVSFN